MAGFSHLGAQVVRDSVPQLDRIDVEEHLGEYLPMELGFTDDRGRAVKLGDYFDSDQPVLLVLGYYECPMLCNLVLNGVIQGVKDLKWQPGRDYQIVTVSINPAETHQLAAAKKKNYLQALGNPSVSEGFSLLVGEGLQSSKLADALGFKYYWDEKRQEYAHPAVIYMIAADGKITRYLYGIEFDEQSLKLALMEASEGKIGNTIDRLILYCYHYDPDSEGYVIVAGNVMRLGGLTTLIILGGFLGWLWRRERNRRPENRLTVYSSR